MILLILYITLLSYYIECSSLQSFLSFATSNHLDHMISSERNSSIGSSPMSVAVLGGGNWGTTIARRVALNVLLKPDKFCNEVMLWLMDEMVDGRSLIDIIMVDRINSKYLPDIVLPSNILPNADLALLKHSDIIIITIPHQYLESVLDQLKGIIKPTAIAVSLSKGLFVEPTGPKLLSDMIASKLNLTHVAVLMGANIASEVAQDHYVEATLASTSNETIGILKELFECETFHIQTSNDVSSVEICGALKNVVSVAAGFCEGLRMGISSKSAVIRQGIHEIKEFCKLCSTSQLFDVRI